MSSIHPTNEQISTNERHLIADGFVRINLPNGNYGYCLPQHHKTCYTNKIVNNKSKTKKDVKKEWSLCILH